LQKRDAHLQRFIASVLKQVAMDLDIFDNFAAGSSDPHQKVDNFESSSALLDSTRKKRKLDQEEEDEEPNSKTVSGFIISKGPIKMLTLFPHRSRLKKAPWQQPPPLRHQVTSVRDC
jgi:hypothetical protein